MQKVKINYGINHNIKTQKCKGKEMDKSETPVHYLIYKTYRRQMCKLKNKVDRY